MEVLQLLFYLFVFVFGAIVGSFLNVVICRYNTGISALSGRSKCFSCGKMLSWRELVPVASFFLQRGKCMVCKSGISWQYPIVEAITGLLFVVVFWLGHTLFEILYLLVLVSIFVVISVYDIKHKIIPDGFVYSFILLSLLPLLFYGSTHIIDWLAGPIAALPFALLWLFSKGRWMGLGDAKVALGMGWLLGLSKALAATIIAVWTGAIVGVLLIVSTKIPKVKRVFSVSGFNGKSELPFGPFLLGATLIVLMLDIDVFNLLEVFW